MCIGDLQQVDGHCVQKAAISSSTDMDAAGNELQKIVLTGASVQFQVLDSDTPRTLNVADMAAQLSDLTTDDAADDEAFESLLDRLEAVEDELFRCFRNK